MDAVVVVVDFNCFQFSFQVADVPEKNGVQWTLSRTDSTRNKSRLQRLSLAWPSNVSHDGSSTRNSAKEVGKNRPKLGWQNHTYAVDNKVVGATGFDQEKTV